MGKEKEENIWFTSDLHLSHKNIMKYCNRPFNDVHHMNHVIISNLVDNIGDHSTLYILGDLTFDKKMAEVFFDTLKGKLHDLQIHYMFGNHDRGIRSIIKKNCASYSDIKNIKIEDQRATLCHFPMRTWHKSHFDSWNLHGHCHGTLEPQGKQLDVGVDAHGFNPVPWSMIKGYMSVQPSNIHRKDHYFVKNNN